MIQNKTRAVQDLGMLARAKENQASTDAIGGRSSLSGSSAAVLALAMCCGFAGAAHATSGTSAAPQNPSLNLASSSPGAAPLQPPTVTDSSVTGTPSPPPPADTDSQESVLEQTKNALTLKGWNIPVPGYEDSVTQDMGGYRTTLAEHGIGFLGWINPTAAIDVLNRPRSINGKQVYWGQSPDIGESSLAVLTFDLGRIGLDGGQLAIGGNVNRSTYKPFIPNANTLYRLVYYQSLFHDRVEFAVGYMGNTPTFVGTYVGGEVQNPFGPNASIPSELGLSSSAVSQPTAWLRVHPTKFTYDMFGVARSVSPGGILTELEENPTSATFTSAGTGPLYINEIGYRTVPAPDFYYTWFRVGIIYNTTRYPDYGTENKSTKSGYYALFDQQLTQLDSSSTPQAYRGLYAGASAMYTSPKTSIFSQYYEFRLYGKGLLASRPLDTANIVYTHQVTSKRLADVYNTSADATGTFAADNTNSVTVSYTAHLVHGVFGTVGLQYLDHPSFTYTKNEGSALNALFSAFVVF